MHYHELVFSTEATLVLKKAYGKFLHKLNLGKTIQPAYLGALTVVMREQLYAQEALAAFWKKVEAAPESTHHLHLMHRDKELLNLPWQMAIDENKHPSVYISKGFTIEQPLAAYTPQAGPLKVLIMISSPEDEKADKRLSYEKEEEALLEALKPLYEKKQVQVSFTITGSLESLEASLAKEHFHLLYFSGHSIYKHNTGSLLLEDETTMEGIEVTGDLFAATVCKYKAHIPALVIMASCQSAEGNTEEGFPGVTDELIAAGVPAVIAMAFSISDRYITVFAAHLFEALAQQEVLLEAYIQALHGLETAEATYAMEEDYDLAPTQWLIPQLYLSRPVVHIAQWAGGKTITQEEPTPPIAGSKGEYRFIGRRHELGRLLPLLHAGRSVLLIGQAGVGKTALADKAVQRLLAADNRQVQFRFESGKLSMEAIKSNLQDLLLTHGMAPIGSADPKTTGLEYLLETVRKVFRLLWVVDDMETIQSFAGGPVRDEHKIWLNWFLQQVIPYEPVLFISRYTVPELADMQALAVDEASPADLFAHLKQLGAGAILSTQPDADPLTITEIVYNALGGHYRSWACFDRLYNEKATALWKIIEKIWSAENPKSTQPLYDKIAKNVLKEMDKEGWSASLNQLRNVLEKQDWQALQLLAHFRRPVSIRALEMQDAEFAWQPVLAKLHGLALVEKHITVINNKEETRYYATRLIKKWVQQQTVFKVNFFDKPAGDYYYTTAKETNEWNAYVEAFWHYLPGRHVEQINETGEIVARMHYNTRDYEDTLVYAFHTLDTCEEATNPEILNIIGAVYKQLGNVEETLKFWTAFLEATIQIGNQVQKGLALNNLAALFHELGDKEDAKTTMEAALTIARETNDQEQVASRLNSLGKLVEDLDPKYAMSLYEESLQLQKEMDNRAGEATTMLNLADAYERLGEVEKAKQSLRFCITIFKEEGNIDNQAMAYEKLGELYQNHGENEVAMDLLNEALELYHLLRDRAGQSRILNLIGSLLTYMAYYDQALDCLTTSLILTQQLYLKKDEAGTMVLLSDLYRIKGEPDEGIPYANSAMLIYKELKDQSGKADVLFQLGRLYFDKGDTKMSNKYFKQSKKLFETFGPAARQDIMDSIDSHLAIKDLTKQLSILQKQLIDVRKKGNKLYQAEVLYQMAEIALYEDNIDDFFDWMDEAYDIYVELEHVQGIYRAGVVLGHELYLSEDAEDRDEGLTLLQQCFQIGQNEGYPENHKIAEFIRDEAP